MVSVSPGFYGNALLSGPVQSQGAELKGIPVNKPPEMLLHLKQGSFDDLRNAGGLPGIILGAKLAQSTGMLLNSVVHVIVPLGELTPFGPKSATYQFRVVGIFESGFYEIDSVYGFMDLNWAQRIFGVGNVVNSIELRLDDIYKAPEVAQAVQKIAGPSLVANTWMEQYKQILGALSSESLVTALTIGLIQLVAALNILITLIMMVMEKNRDIALLMSMGARREQIRKIFVLQGVLIGLVGTVDRAGARLHAFLFGGPLPLAESEPGCVLVQLRSVQRALAGRRLDRGGGDFRELRRDAVPCPKRDADRAGGGAAV